jgi:hypothetical protein
MPKKFVHASISIDWDAVSQEVERISKMNYLPSYLRNVWNGLVRSGKVKQTIEKIINAEYQEVKAVVELLNK